MKKAAYALLFVVLIASNILSITSAKFHDLLAGMFSYIPVPELMAKSKKAENKKLMSNNKKLATKNAQLESRQKKISANLKKVKDISAKSKTRIAGNASKNVAALIPSSIPMIGIATNVAMTSADVVVSCETMKAFDEMETLFMFEESVDQTEKICGIEVPTTEEVTKAVEAKMDSYTHKIRETIGGTIHQMQMNISEYFK